MSDEQQDGMVYTVQGIERLEAEIDRLRAENAKLRAAGLELVSQTIAAQQAEIEKLRAILFQFAAYDDGYESADCGAMTVITVPIGVIRAAAAALKETGDE